MDFQNQLSRREFLEKGLSVGGVIIGSSLLGACRSSPEPTARTALKGKVGAHTWALDSVAGQSVPLGGKEAARQFGLQSKTFIYDIDNTKELAQIDQMATAGFNVIPTVIIDNGITRQLAEAAARNNVYLSTFAQVGQWIVPSEPGIDYHYQCLAYAPDGAYITCKNMFTKLGGSGTFAHLTGAPGSATSIAKDKAIDRALSEFPGIRMVARQEGGFSREPSRVVMDAILTANNNKIDCIFCQNDDSALGAMASLRGRGLLGKVLVGGADGIPEMIDAIIAGDAFGTEGAVVFYGAGYATVQALDAANGHKPDPVESLMVQDFLMVDNVESASAYKELVYGPDGGPSLFDFQKMSRVLHPDDWDPQWPIRTFSPDEFWAKNQDIPKPAGYELPENYVSAVASGGYDRVNKLYNDRMKSFPFADIARKSSTGKTMFEQLYGVSYG